MYDVSPLVLHYFNQYDELKQLYDAYKEQSEQKLAVEHMLHNLMLGTGVQLDDDDDDDNGDEDEE